MTFTRAAIMLVLFAIGSSACDACGSSSTPPQGSDASEVEASAETMGDAATPCSGAAVDLAVAVGDGACAITSGIAKSTRAVFEIAADAGKQVLRQEAVRLEDGRVEVRVVNRGASPVAIPLSWHPKIPTFIVLADNPKEKAIYELEAPSLGVELDGGPATARFARVTIAPGGYAFARIAIDSRIVKRAGRAGGAGVDAGALPSRLAEGRWIFHIGQLVSDVDTGEPATLAIDIEAHD